ncbi:terminase gpA endonuclease subunit [Leptospira interrogans]
MPSTTFSALSPTDLKKLAPIFERAAILSKPTRRSTPDVWAKDNRVYPPSADRPGARDVGLTPYVIDFERAFEDPRYDTVVLACGSQMGKSEAVLDVIGQRFDQRPAPSLYVGPSQDFLRDEIEPRLTALIDQAPPLARKVSRGKKSTKFRKVIGGVPLRLLWAGSATQLSGTTAELSMVDELDRMQENVKGEGDPLGLVRARGFTYRDRKYGVTSTPKAGNVDVVKCEKSGLEFWKKMPPEDIESPIWRLWQQGTMYHFAWPCPQCDEFFIPRFRNLRWPEKATPAEARRSAYIECPRCGGIVEEAHKPSLNARGVYVAPGQHVTIDGVVHGDPPDTTTTSFWVSGLCSPFVTIGERAAAYIEAKDAGSQEQLQAATNTGFGELWAPGDGDVPEWTEVAQLKRPYQKKRLDLPAGVRLLTLTADVQRNRILYVIRGWGARATSWLVDNGELHGPTTEEDIWADLSELLDRPIGDLSIRRAFVDSGFRPGKPDQVPVNRVYEWCRRHRSRVWPTKGRATQDKPLVVSRIEVTQQGIAKKYGLELVWLDTDHFKSWVHERIRWPDDRPGAWMLPEDVEDDYCKQIVSEARVKKPNGQPQWVQRSRENHYLDCEAMQAAVGHMLSVHLIRDDTPVPAAPAPPPTDQSTSVKATLPVKADTQKPNRKPEPPMAAADARARRAARAAALGQRMR